MGDAMAAATEDLFSERPWLRAYDHGVPAEIDLPEEPLHAALAAMASAIPPARSDNSLFTMVSSEKSRRNLNASVSCAVSSNKLSPERFSRLKC